MKLYKNFISWFATNLENAKGKAVLFGVPAIELIGTIAALSWASKVEKG